jgi:hypothetical protein
VWVKIARLLSERQPRKSTNNPQLEHQVVKLLSYTIDSLHSMNHKDLTTTILSMTKDCKECEGGGAEKQNQ